MMWQNRFVYNNIFRMICFSTYAFKGPLWMWKRYYKAAWIHHEKQIGL